MSRGNLSILKPGAIVAGQYQVVRCLSVGSSAVVYKCLSFELGQTPTVLKIFRPEAFEYEVAAIRFLDEIVATYRVSHDHVVKAYDCFQCPDCVGYTMEYLTGGDLIDLLGDRKMLPLKEVVSLIRQIALGLLAVHRAGIVHRDIKPENILMTGEGVAKITDFGIARRAKRGAITERNGIVGTIDYISPEYLEFGEVDSRSDIYALGTIAYELTTGHKPYQGSGIMGTIMNKLRTDPVRPCEYRPDCPSELEALILKALERHPDFRYRTCAELLRDLSEIDPQAIHDDRLEK
jgi:serine/threonine protein kinase